MKYERDSHLLTTASLLSVGRVSAFRRRTLRVPGAQRNGCRILDTAEGDDINIMAWLFGDMDSDLYLGFAKAR